jgi:hypothetical protein
VLLLIVIAGAATGCGETKPPKLSVLAPVLEFGFVPRQGKDMEIPLENKGESTLRILQVGASLACKVADCPATIAPGQRGTLVLKAPTWTVGPQSARVIIKSNDPAGPYELYLSWFGESPPCFDPPAIIEHGISGHKVFEKKVTLGWAGGDPRYGLEVAKIATSDARISLQLLSSNPTGKRFQSKSSPGANDHAILGETTFLLRCKTLGGVHHLKGECMVSVNQAGVRHDVRLPVDLTITRGITIFPEALLFSSSGKRFVGMTKRLMVQTHQSAAPNVSICPRFLKCKAAIVGGGDDGGELYRLDIQVVEEPPSGSAELGLQVASQEESLVKVPIQFTSLK